MLGRVFLILLQIHAHSGTSGPCAAKTENNTGGITRGELEVEYEPLIGCLRAVDGISIAVCRDEKVRVRAFQQYECSYLALVHNIVS